MRKAFSRNKQDISLMERGYTYKPGFVRKELFILISMWEEGIEEPILREKINEKLGLTAQRNIKSHLNSLLLDNVIKKTITPGKSNIWSVESSIEAINYIIDSILLDDDENSNIIKFFKNPGIQNAIKGYIGSWRLEPDNKISESFGMNNAPYSKYGLVGHEIGYCNFPGNRNKSNINIPDRRVCPAAVFFEWLMLNSPTFFIGDLRPLTEVYIISAFLKTNMVDLSMEKIKENCAYFPSLYLIGISSLIVDYASYPIIRMDIRDQINKNADQINKYYYNLNLDLILSTIEYISDICNKTIKEYYVKGETNSLNYAIFGVTRGEITTSCGIPPKNH